MMNQFIKKLSKLENSKEEIFELKNIAESMPDNAKQINEVIVANYKTANNDKRLAILYLMDALLKSSKDVYLKLIEEKITDIFCDVYKNSPDHLKNKLVLTYYSWEPYFLGQTMKKIQYTIKKSTGDEVEKLLTEEDLNKLIDYYDKNSIDPTHLVMLRDDLRSKSKATIKKSKINHIPV